MGPWMGYLLDNNPGAEGHHKVFAVLALFALLGLRPASFSFPEQNREMGCYMKLTDRNQLVFCILI